jgi:hypothetical protein
MPSFMRLGSWNIVMFVSYEQIKRGMAYFAQRSNDGATPVDPSDINKAVTSVNTSSNGRYM